MAYSLGGTTGSASSSPASTFCEPIAEAVAQFVGRVVRLRAALFGGDRAGRGDAGGTGQTEELPTRLHGSRRLPAVNQSALPFDEAVDTAATGDLWLFRGRSVADRAIQA